MVMVKNNNIIFINLEKELTLEQGDFGQELYVEYNNRMLDIVNSNDLRNFIDDEVNEYIKNNGEIPDEEYEVLRNQFAAKYVMEKPFERLMKLQQFKIRSKMFDLRSRILALITHFEKDNNSLSNYDTMLQFWKNTPLLETEQYNSEVQKFINFFTRFLTDDSDILQPTMTENPKAPSQKSSITTSKKKKA